MKSFQERVNDWVVTCFGAKIADDKEERNHRFLEEALELVQSCGCSREAAHSLVDYVFDRPVGEKEQEVGGVYTTLAALCRAQGMDVHAAGDKELERVWSLIDKIREKQRNKPKFSPLAEHVLPKNKLRADMITRARDAEAGRGVVIGNEPDRFCTTTPDGSCVSTDPRCMHQVKAQVRCETCVGLGEDWNEGDPCHVCGGSGKVNAKDQD